MNRYRVAISSDHAGFRLKEELKVSVRELGHEVRDLGTSNPDDRVDYPDYAFRAVQAVASERCDLGIVVCGTGIGSCITANKVKGIRAALCHDVYSARQSRRHNNANVLCLGERVIGVELAKAVVQAWLESDYSHAERHERRLAKIAALERE